MDKLRFISILLICNILLSSCGLISKLINNSQQNIKQNETKIENLSDGNYRYCSDPNPYPYEDKIDVHRYCFTFTKTGIKVVGYYLYRAPKDTPYICIEGKVENNFIVGAGYEKIYTKETWKPYTENDFSPFLEQFPFNGETVYWDNTEQFQGGNNLKVGSLGLYNPSLSRTNKYPIYWALIRFENSKLDLNGFESVISEKLPDYKSCNS